MATRCNIIVGDRQFYHHWDGYPDGVGADLAYFVANINASSDPPSLKAIADGISESGVIGRLHTGDGRDRSYEPEEFGLHSDIEYLYLIDGKKGDYKLYRVDVWQYIQSTPFEGSHWEHPFFSYGLSALKKRFETAEFEVQLPSAEVPEKERIYACTGILSHDEARYCGMKEDLGYGEREYCTGFVRVRNEKGSAKEYPNCPKCNGFTGPQDFKSNGVENGCYYESYKCPICGERFSVTYDTPNDSGSWTVDSQSVKKHTGWRKYIFRRWAR